MIATFIKITRVEDGKDENEVDIIGNIYEREENSTEYKLVLENVGIVSFNKLENLDFFQKRIDNYLHNELIHIDVVEDFKAEILLNTGLRKWH